MHTTATTDDNGVLQSAPRIRELTPAETNHVSGGIIPILVVAAVIAIAALEQSGDDDSQGDAQDDD